MITVLPWCVFRILQIEFSRKNHASAKLVFFKMLSKTLTLSTLLILALNLPKG